MAQLFENTTLFYNCINTIQADFLAKVNNCFSPLYAIVYNINKIVNYLINQFKSKDHTTRSKSYPGYKLYQSITKRYPCFRTENYQ